LRTLTRLGRQPFANDASAALAIVRPTLREAIVDDVVALDAERVVDDPGGAVAIVAVDRLLENVGHAANML
jgi:hypothetical protein